MSNPQQQTIAHQKWPMQNSIFFLLSQLPLFPTWQYLVFLTVEGLTLLKKKLRARWHTINISYPKAVSLLELVLWPSLALSIGLVNKRDTIHTLKEKVNHLYRNTGNPSSVPWHLFLPHLACCQLWYLNNDSLLTFMLSWLNHCLSLVRLPCLLQVITTNGHHKKGYNVH